MIVVLLILLGACVIAGTVIVEWSDEREKRRRYAEWRDLERARRVTGRVGTAKRWES